MFIETALVVIFTMAFSQGIFLFIGIPTLVPRMIMELLILTLFAVSFFTKMIRKDKFIVFGLLPLMGFFAVTCLSSYINNDPMLSFALFCRHIFIFYIFFMALLNLKISRRTIYKINNYLIFLFLIQILANFVKFLIVGQVEGKGIGTMSITAGSLTTTFVLFAITFCFALFLFKREKKYIIMIIGFFLFGVIGAKRAVSFYLPLLFAACAYIYLKRVNSKIVFLSKSTIKVLFSVVILSVVSMYGAARMVPSLNPEEKVGGSFDISYIASYAKNTVAWRAEGFEKGQIFDPKISDKFNTSGRITLGRYSTTLRSFEVLHNAGWTGMLFGLGMDNLAESSLLDRKSLEKIMEEFNIRYGITGFTWVLLQVGSLGVIFLVYFYFKVFRKTLRLYRCSVDENYQAVALGFIGINLVFFLDFFTYSTSSLTLGVLTPVYFYIAFLLFRGFVPNCPEHESLSTVEETLPCKK